MKFRKVYSLKQIKSAAEMMMSEGRERINFLELITLVGFDKKDIAKFYKEFIGRREYYYPEDR